MRVTVWSTIAVGLLGGLLVCGGPGRAQAQSQQLSYSGSSTIGESCLPEMIKAFTKKTGLAFGKVDIPGSTEGFKALMAGDTPIAGLSRPLSAEEKAQKPHALIIGFDLYVNYVHTNNAIKNLSDTQLKDIFAGKITDWQQVGGAPGPITVVITDPKKHATVVEFKRLVLGTVDYAATAKILASHEETLRYVAQHPEAITFASISFNPTGVHVVSINKVAPSLETARDGSYRFQRPLYLVSKEVPKGDVQKFFDFVLSSEGQAIVARYFLPISGR